MHLYQYHVRNKDVNKSTDLVDIFDILGRRNGLAKLGFFLGIDVPRVELKINTAAPKRSA